MFSAASASFLCRSRNSAGCSDKAQLCSQSRQESVHQVRSLDSSGAAYRLGVLAQRVVLVAVRVVEMLGGRVLDRVLHFRPRRDVCCPVSGGVRVRSVDLRGRGNRTAVSGEAAAGRAGKQQKGTRLAHRVLHGVIWNCLECVLCEKAMGGERGREGEGAGREAGAEQICCGISVPPELLAPS